MTSIPERPTFRTIGFEMIFEVILVLLFYSARQLCFATNRALAKRQDQIGLDY